MYGRKAVIALATSFVALAYVAAVQVVAAIKYFDNGEEEKEENKEKEKEDNSGE